MIVFLVSGLWHGAAWTYGIWGAIHGIYQVIGNLTVKKRNSVLEGIGLRVTSPLVVWSRRTITFILVTFAWLFFRANSVQDAFTLLGKIFTSFAPKPMSVILESMGLNLVAILTCFVSFLIVLVMDRIVKYEDDERLSGVLVKKGAFIYVVWVIMFAWAILLAKDVVGTFIYFQF
jgi:D-alanyl-lipoteichoic acid acyltransferase DltB (MBOAT superfamily)